MSFFPILSGTPTNYRVAHRDLISYWKLDEASGSREDIHGSNDLTDNNTVTQAAGKIGNAALFTATNTESLSRADNASLSTGDIDFTFAGWVYITTTGNKGIAGKGAAGGGGQYEWAVYSTSATNIRFSCYKSDAGNQTNSDVTVASLADNWHFVVCWHDTTADTVNLQVDNGTVTSTARGAFTMSDTTSGFSMGRIDDDGLFLFDGRIDECSFWKRVLNAAERTTLYNNGNGLAYPFS